MGSCRPFLYAAVEILLKLAYLTGLVSNAVGLVGQHHYPRWGGLLASTGCAVLLLIWWALTRRTTNHRYVVWTIVGLTAVFLGNLTLAEPLDDFLDYTGFLCHLIGVFSLFLAFSAPTRVPTRARNVNGGISGASKPGKQPLFLPLPFRAVRFVTPFLTGLAIVVSWPILSPDDGGNSNDNDGIDTTYPKFVAACCLVAAEALMVWRAIARIGYAGTNNNSGAIDTGDSIANNRGNASGVEGKKKKKKTKSSSSSSMLLALPLESPLYQWSAAIGAILLSVGIAALGYDRLCLDDDPNADVESTRLRKVFTAAYCLAFWFGQTMIVVGVPFYPLPSPLSLGALRSRSSNWRSNSYRYQDGLSASPESDDQDDDASSAAPLGLLESINKDKTAISSSSLFFYDLGHPAITPPPLMSTVSAVAQESAANLASSSSPSSTGAGASSSSTPSSSANANIRRRVAILLPDSNAGFDAAEVAVTWWSLTKRGHQVVFVTKDGRAGIRARKGLLPTPYPPSLFGYSIAAGSALEEIKLITERLQGDVVAAALRGTGGLGSDASASAPSLGSSSPPPSRRKKRAAAARNEDDDGGDQPPPSSSSSSSSSSSIAADFLDSSFKSEDGCAFRCCNIFSCACRVFCGGCLFGAFAACLSSLFCVSCTSEGLCCCAGNKKKGKNGGEYKNLNDEEEDEEEDDDGSSSIADAPVGVFAPSPLVIHLYHTMLKSQAFRNPLAWSKKAAAVASAAANAAATASQHASASSAMIARGLAPPPAAAAGPVGSVALVRPAHFIGLTTQGLGLDAGNEKGKAVSGRQCCLSYYFTSCLCPRSCPASPSASSISLLLSSTFLRRLGAGDEDDGSHYFEETASTSAEGKRDPNSSSASADASSASTTNSSVWKPENCDALVIVGAIPASAHDMSPWSDDKELLAALSSFTKLDKPVACFGNAILPFVRSTGAEKKGTLLRAVTRAALTGTAIDVGAAMGSSGESMSEAGNSLGSHGLLLGSSDASPPILLTTLPADAQQCHSWLLALFACDCYNACATRRRGGFSSVEEEATRSLASIDRRGAVLVLPSISRSLGGGLCGFFWSSLAHLFCTILLRCEVPVLRKADPFADERETLVVESGQLLTGQGSADAFALARRLLAKIENTSRRAF